MANKNFEAVVDVIMNGKEAENELTRLAAKIEETKKANEEAWGKENQDDIKRTAKELEKLYKQEADIKRGVDDYNKALNNISTSNIKELENAAKLLYEQMRRLPPESMEFAEAAKNYSDVTKRISSLKTAYKEVGEKQSGLLATFNKLQGLWVVGTGILGKVATALRGVAKFTSQVIHSSQTMGDAWDNAVTAMKTTTEAFFVALSTGNWDAFNGGLREAIKNAKEYAATLDQLESRRISNDYMQSEYLTNYREDMVAANDKSQDEATRQAALESAKQNLAEYINSIEKLGSDTRDNLMASYKAMFGIDYTGDELGFEKFFDELYKNVIVGENETVNQIIDERDQRVRELSHQFEVYGDQIVYTYTHAEAMALANREAENKYGTEVYNLAKAYEQTDDALKANLESFKQYTDAKRQATRYEKQLNTESATFEKQIESEKAAAAKKALEDKKAAAAAAYEAQMKQIEKERYATRQHYAEMYMKGEIDKKAYDAQMIVIEDAYLAEKLALNQRFGKDTDAISQTILDRQIKRYEEAKNKDAADKKKKYDEELSLLKQSQKDEETELKKQLTRNEITQDEYDSKMLAAKVNYLKQSVDLAAEYGQDETQIMQAYLDAQVEAEILALQQMEKLKKEAKDVKDSLRTPDEVRGDDMAKELARLEELHDAKLLSEEEYEKAVQAVHDKYKQEQLDEDLEGLKGYFEKANKVMEGVSGFVSQLQSAETANLEAEYQARLTAAGDNAEKREKIEAQYEKDKLDIQKKYADAEMAIGIGQAVADGAIAIARAFKDYPYAVAIPIAALVAATTAAQVSTIIQQRNAIKNISVSSKGSSTSVSSGGSDVGRRVFTGYSEGGYTGAGGKYEPAGIVHHGEWVAPKWMVQSNPVVFSNLERYRRAGGHGRSGSSSKGFADGGYTEPVAHGAIGGFAPIELSESSCRMLAAAIAEIGVTIVQLDKALSDKHAMENRFKAKTSI